MRGCVSYLSTSARSPQIGTDSVHRLHEDFSETDMDEMKKGSSSKFLQLDGPITSWDEGLPLGNGLLGLLIWGGDGSIRISIDRGDLWDTRCPDGADLNWDELRDLVQAGKWTEISDRCLKPTLGSPFPTKLPAGRMHFQLPKGKEVSSFVLNRLTGVGVAQWKEGRLEAFCDQAGSVACLRFRGAADWSLEPRPYGQPAGDDENAANIMMDLASLGYPASRRWRDAVSSGFVQATECDGAFALATVVRKTKAWTEIVLAVERGRNFKEAKKQAKGVAIAACSEGWEKLLNRSKREWLRLWKRSSVAIPDSRLGEQYLQASYFLKAASRPGGPPISLQALWTADDGRLPPWKGDYHHDLNTQLSYWPHLTAGHGDRMRGFLDFMFDLRPMHREMAEKFFGVDGIFVPGSMAFDGQAIGGYAQVSYSPTNGAWVAWMFYQYWKYTGDVQYLRSHVFPYCRDTAKLISALLREDGDGWLKLPLSSSPEIHEGGPGGWLRPNSHYDLTLMRWNFAALVELGDVLGEDTAQWRQVLGKLEPLAVSNITEDETPVEGRGAFLVAPETPLHVSHRHHSHLMAVYPLGLVSIEDGPETCASIEASLKQIDRLGTGLWTGFSFVWMACLAARSRQAERARRALQTFEGCFLSRNGFHLNGDYRRQGVSWWNYRPFTLESNLAFLEAIHEMLLQSWRGVIRVFPAVPLDWKSVSFDRLRAEGGLIVSARRKQGESRKVTVKTSCESTIRLEDPFHGRGQWSHPGKVVNGLLEFSLPAHASLVGKAPGA